MISILPLFLLLGVVISKHISYYDNSTIVEPIITHSQERRICAELCMSGLGGEPCGDDCREMTPQGMPLHSPQSKNESEAGQVVTRQRVCPVLCANRLGYPLCKCNYNTNPHQPFFRVNYAKICTHFCVLYDYEIYGCESCDVYKNDTKLFLNNFTFHSGTEETREVDWNVWCQQMCREGEGGAACNCDLLPMSLIN